MPKLGHLSKHLESCQDYSYIQKGRSFFVYLLQSISLLQCISKIFAKFLFKLMCMVLCENTLITKHQSGFTLGDSTINQLISIGDCHILPDLRQLQQTACKHNVIVKVIFIHYDLLADRAGLFMCVSAMCWSAG